jgi:co-chaperonin GroES (HSP10)
VTNSYTQNGIKYTVRGFHVIVEIDGAAPTLGSGIIQMAPDTYERVMQSKKTGILRAVGSLAWSDKGEPFAKVGDRVILKPYAGESLNRKDDGSLPQDEPVLRVMPDLEILGTIERVENE